MGIVLAIVTAITYGVADWTGGHAARRMNAMAVTVVGQTASMVMVAIALVVLGDPAAGLGWGALAGTAGVVGLVFFYTGLAAGSMTVVAPVTAMVGLCAPVIVGLALGDRLSASAWLGVAAAVIAVALVGGIVGAAHAPVRRRDLIHAVLAGLGFGFVFVCLDRAPDDAGMWPLLGARLASVTIGLVVLAVFRRRASIDYVRTTPSRRGVLLAVAAGLLDMTANASFLAASRHGMLAVIAVISSMYPVTTIALAMGVDRERVSRSQIVGMAVAVLAVVLVSTTS